ncbi:N-acetyltransferase [Novosphingobium sediminis]|uniref:N-acetyltransferase n=1 Tax=Novosphingobium sediminis TaxID=707214 RepID=A0A512AH56_9SPHN|nr:GNAT family N-acetyltransferase [Novosphingobium sediminis]GEN98982.1 N-acetyltransferase [Novosphingobium sediminis]
MESPLLATRRLILRKPVPADSVAIIDAVGDWDVARNLSLVPHPYGAAEVHFFLEEVVTADWGWAITWAGEEKLLGVVGLSPAEDGTSAELGYWLGRAHWGQGIATEAVRAVVNFAFDKLSLEKITSGHFKDNPASGKVLAKLGFVETGRSMRPCLARGGPVASIDVVLSVTTH